MYASQPVLSRRRRSPCLLTALGCLVSFTSMTQAFAGERILHAGSGQLEISVNGIEDPAREAMLQQWAQEAATTLLTASERFPLPRIRTVVRETDSRDPSPVPWGQTLRRDGVSVLLYVRPDATFEQLRDDWTAVHEFSHLMHPYLGREGRWMAEGLASYYQNVLRARAALMPPDQAWRRLDAGFERGRRAPTGVALSSARGRGATMRIYWAGAAYWLQTDLALRERGSSLDAVLAAYARCCLSDRSESTPLAFAQALDRIDGHDLFVRLYHQYAAATEFPDLTTAYRTLGLSGSGPTLRFSEGDAPARLRMALMRAR
jgi:hypothetical protein